MQNQNTRKRLLIALISTLLGVALSSTGFAKNEIEFIPGEDSGFFYIIKKGDTLWDLSQKFYNSQWDWPALWEMNDEIKNPHWIYPGKRIRIFFKENAKLAPKIVTMTKSEKVPEKIKPSFSFSQMDHIGFVRKTEHPALGSIIREKEGNLIMSTDDIIYIKPSGKGTLIPGKTYHIYSTEKLKEEINDQTCTGIKHLIKAKIKVIAHNVTYVSAVITHSYRAVEKNDLIMEYYDRDEILTVEEAPSPIDARIICSEDNTTMINDYRIAFINTGKDKVKPGQIYTVMRKNETKDYTLWKPGKKESIPLENLKSGKLIVLHTEDIAATVMILSSEYAIHPDDMVN
ncbi:MAG: LysM peptidoglycan-binding domain-containing protein [Pseudomonadota bacterium]